LNFEPDVAVTQSRRRKTHRWRRSLFIFVITPLTVWFLAFLIWLFWHDIMRLVAPGKATPRPATSSPRDWESSKNHGPLPAQRPREDIPDGDRKKLDDVLKQR
jgi:hypothetical protein